MILIIQLCSWEIVTSILIMERYIGYNIWFYYNSIMERGSKGAKTRHSHMAQLSLAVVAYQ